MNTFIRGGLLIMVLTGIVAGLMGCASGEKTDGTPGQRFQRPEASVSPARAATPVEVSRVVEGEIASYLLFSSSVETENTADLYPKVSGEIVQIFYDEGQFVRQGEPIFQLDDREYRLQAERARVNYEQLTSELERMERLKEKELVSAEEYERVKFSVDQAKVDYELANLNLQYTRILAPFDGVVAERFVKLGDRVNPSTRLARFANLNEKIAVIYVPQYNYPNIYLKQEAVITSDNYPAEEFRGWIKRLSPAIDPASGTFKVTVGIRDPKNRLNPGMFVNVAIILDVHRNARLIPKTALVYESEKSFFYKVQQGKALKLELKKGYEDAQKVEVFNGIAVGDTVVVVGQNALKDGANVKVVKEVVFDWQKKNMGSKQVSSAQ